MRSVLLGFTLALISTLAFAAEPDSADLRSWPQWRGPLASGFAPYADPPVEWSESKNVRWKIEIPGKGSASPVVWQDKVFVLTAVPVGDPVASEGAPEPAPGRRGPRGIQATRVQQFTILAIDRHDGSVRWQKVLREQLPHEGTHATGSWASPSPATDGERIYAFFGSFGLYCLDLDGNLVWEKDFGDMSTRLAFGEGSSPFLYDDKIVVNWDHEGPSFIVVLDKKTGKEVWRRDRDEVTSWSTPIVIEHDGRRQTIVSATERVRSYDLEDGELLWQIGGMTVNVIPSPVHAEGVVLVTSGFRGNALLAIRLDGAGGDLTDSDHVLWTLDRDTPYTPSPLLYGDQVYFLKTNSGILSSFHFKTGKRIFGPVRLEGVPNVYASPVGAAGRIYIAGRDGATAVLEHSPDFKILAENSLEDGFDASPALVDNEIFLRGKRYLYRISEGR